MWDTRDRIKKMNGGVGFPFYRKGRRSGVEFYPLTIGMEEAGKG